MSTSGTRGGAQSVTLADLEALRVFDRFYTRHVGALDESLLGTELTLPQARLLWELGQQQGTTAAELAHSLALDAGYLSRLLGHLRARRWVSSRRSRRDARQHLLSLTERGQLLFDELNRRAADRAATLLAPLSSGSRQELRLAMARVRGLLSGHAEGRILVRTHRPGDIGWIISRHGAVYAQEYGWNAAAEALVARIGAQFLAAFDESREACWIGEVDGTPVASVMLVQATEGEPPAPVAGTAQLRLLLVEPHARGLGLGRLLTAKCEAFARQAGYRRIRLWTNQNLVAARSIYSSEGYRLIDQEARESFGHRLVGETWVKELD